MVGGDEQAHLPRRPPPQRWWVVILKIVSLSLLLFPSSTSGKWQFDFEPETRPLPTALAPEGEQGGGEREVWTAGQERQVLCGACTYVSRSAQECAVCRGVCGV